MFESIIKNYIKNIITSEQYEDPDPFKGRELLVPEFNEALTKSIAEFNVKYPDIEVVFVETYRSNVLQLQHYNNGASKIKKNGMHHYAIAADLAFKVKGKFTYNGDYEFLRECHTKQGLNLLGVWDIGHVQMIPVSEQDDLRLAVVNGIKKFQKDTGLIADGIVGPKTIEKAISERAKAI